MRDLQSRRVDNFPYYAAGQEWVIPHVIFTEDPETGDWCIDNEELNRLHLYVFQAIMQRPSLYETYEEYKFTRNFVDGK